MKLPPPGKWYIWILLALFVKGVMFMILTKELGTTQDTYIGIKGGNESGDANSYLMPAEHLLASGNYDMDYRMPFYTAIYYWLRLALNASTTHNLLVIIQTVLSAISVFVLAKIALLLFNSVRLFYLVFFSFLISTYTQLFDLYLLTESLTVSASIFAVYFLIRGIQENRNGYLFNAGSWTTWVIFLRPVYAPYLMFFALILFIHGLIKKKSAGKLISSLFLLMLPFIIIDGLWIMRNYKKYSSIQPLTRSIYYPEAMNSYFVSLMEFLQSWGGSYIFWDPSAEIRLFGIEEPSSGILMKTNTSVRFPENIYTSSFNYDSLQLIRTLIVSVQKKTVSNDSVGVVNELLKEKLKRYTTSIKDEHPYLYHVTSRLKYFKIFLIHSGTYNLMSQPWLKLDIIRKSLKVFYSALYLFVLLGGLAGGIFLLAKYTDMLQLILPFMTFYSVLIFPFILRLPEMRYFVPAYPFILICAMYVTNIAISRLKQNRLIPK